MRESFTGLIVISCDRIFVTPFVVEIAGQTIANIYDYTYALEVLKIGEPAKVVYLRNGERRETMLTPGARK